MAPRTSLRAAATVLTLAAGGPARGDAPAAVPASEGGALPLAPAPAAAAEQPAGERPPAPPLTAVPAATPAPGAAALPAPPALTAPAAAPPLGSPTRRGPVEADPAVVSAPVVAPAVSRLRDEGGGAAAAAPPPPATPGPPAPPAPDRARPPRTAPEPRPPRPAEAPDGADAVPEVYNAVALRFGEARLGLGVQAVGLLPRVELRTALAAIPLGVYPVQGVVQVLDRPHVDLSLRAAAVRSAPGLVVRGEQLGLALSARPAGPLELGVQFDAAQLHLSGLPADGSRLGALTINEGQVSRRISAAIEERREGASAALRDPSIDARVELAALRAQLGLGLHINPHHQVILLGSATPSLQVDARAALIAEGYARLIDVPAEARGLLPSGGAGRAALAQTLAGALAYQWDREALRLRVGAGVGGLGGWGWVPSAVELSWRPGPPDRAGRSRLKPGAPRPPPARAARPAPP